MRSSTLSRSSFFLLMSAAVLGAADSPPRTGLNQHVPSWATVGVAARLRAEGSDGVNFDENDSRAYLLQRYRFSLELRPAQWVRFFGEMQDSREAGAPNPGAGVKDSLDLRQAWVGLGSEGGFWDLKVGRQKMAFGSERVIGAGEWGNVARVFDAVRLGLHRGGDRVELFSSAVVRSDVSRWDHHVQGDNLHGIYGSVNSLLPKTTVEPYLLMRTSRSLPTPVPGGGGYRSWTSGLRLVDDGKSPWGYEVEANGQRGEIGAYALRSWAFTVQGHRRFRDWRWSPTAIAEYNFASGDGNPADSIVNTFDQLYPTNHGKFGIVDQVGRRNIKDAMAALQLHPTKRLILKTEGHSFRLANRRDGLYGAGGRISIPGVAGGAVSSDVGRELDIMADIKISRHYDLGLQVGHLFAGKFIRAYSPGVGGTFYTAFIGLQL